MAKSNGLCTFALPQNQIMGWLKKIFGSKKNDNTGIPPSVETECGNPAEQSNDMIAPAGQLVDVEISAEVELSGTPLVERTREELKPDHHHLERSTPPERSRGAEIPKNMNDIWNDVFFGGRSIGDIIARTSRLNDYGKGSTSSPSDHRATPTTTPNGSRDNHESEQATASASPKG